MDPEARPFDELGELPAPLRVPRWLGALLAGVMAGGVALGALTSGGRVGLAIVRAIFFGSSFAYLTVSIVDFWEHARLEKLLGGWWLSHRAIPIGETVNHWLTLLVLALAIALARPLPAVLAPRDLYVLAAPALFLALGWRDELGYHRRRARHREDILHTVAHLGAAVMLATFYLMRLYHW